MNIKATDPDLDVVASLAIESDELHQPEIDAFIARNREVLNESIRQSLDELDRGIVSKRTIQDIIADGIRQHGHRPTPTVPLRYRRLEPQCLRSGCVGRV
jgi:hypothetical protein